MVIAVNLRCCFDETQEVRRVWRRDGSEGEGERGGRVCIDSYIAFYGTK
jgi:hypothetical protein